MVRETGGPSRLEAGDSASNTLNRLPQHPTSEADNWGLCSLASRLLAGTTVLSPSRLQRLESTGPDVAKRHATLLPTGP